MNDEDFQCIAGTAAESVNFFFSVKPNAQIGNEQETAPALHPDALRLLAQSRREDNVKKSGAALFDFHTSRRYAHVVPHMHWCMISGKPVTFTFGRERESPNPAVFKGQNEFGTLGAIAALRTFSQSPPM